MSDKLIITRERKTNETAVKPVFIHNDILDKIRDLKQETGVSIGRLVEAFIEYGLDHVEIKDSEQ
ncbi:hypothetical protein [Secundilactobacillus kimchicus]|uniref:hypothetical protein n=1 Tax=Secundilactobacillus kimchicus TaxID=528209 RepID=UPI0024A99AF2|nr:hypothetical protein [Secundilactobacillus kimchicus]